MKNQKTIEELRMEIREIVNEGFKLNYEESSKKINLLNAEIKRQQADQLLNRVNREQKGMRDLAKIAWECEQPTEDITNQDGSLHATKTKKYPKLNALGYARAKFDQNKMIELYAGHKFYMVKTVYGSGAPNQYTRPETFEEFLNLNSIMEKDLTKAQFLTISKKIDKMNLDIKKAIEKLDEAKKSIKGYSLEHWGLIERRSENLYLLRNKV